jgi:hypothetical protein
MFVLVEGVELRKTPPSNSLGCLMPEDCWESVVRTQVFLSFSFWRVRNMEAQIEELFSVVRLTATCDQELFSVVIRSSRIAL